MIVILPKDHVDVSWPNFPLYDLIGPCLGGGDWQQKMTWLLEAETKKPDAKLHNFYVVSPMRYAAEHPLLEYQSTGTRNKGEFPQQLDYERYYINLALEKPRSRIICWLGCESVDEPRLDGQPYARDTYGELGELRGRLMHYPYGKRQLIIGAEEGFPGLDVIKSNFWKALGRDFPFYSSMEEVAHQAALAA